MSFIATVWAAAGLLCAASHSTPLPREEAAWYGRVYSVRDQAAVVAFEPQSAAIDRMLQSGLAAITGQTEPARAWQALVSTNGTVGIKVHSSPGAISGTRPAVVEGVIRGLLSAGVARQRIVVWDKREIDLRRAGFAELASRWGVRVAGSVEAGYDAEVFYENNLMGKLVWSDRDFGKTGEEVGKRSYVTRLLTTEIDEVVNVTPLLNHPLAGVAGNLYGLAFASVDNTQRFQTREALAVAVPEIVALPEVGDRVVLNIVDALICQYEGEDQIRLQDSKVLGQLRFSVDPVALDVLSILELRGLRQQAELRPTKPAMEIYSNASLLQLGQSDPERIELIWVE